MEDCTSLIDAAQSYSQRGFSLFPCHSIENGGCTCERLDCSSPAKHPLTSNGVKAATTDADKLKEFFTGDYSQANIALATGEPSGVFVLDVDDADALTKLENENGKLPPTWLVETGSGGLHYYFRFDDRCRSLKNSVKFAGSLDVRTTGGYVLLPPSLHVSGKPYRWLVSPELLPLADAPDWLLSAIPKHDETKPASEQTPSQASSQAGDVDAAATTTATTLVVERAKNVKERAAIYVYNCPPAISGDGGHNTTYRIVCRLIELFGELSDADLLDVLDEWNERCSPPWSKAELRHKLKDARRKTQKITKNIDSDDDSGAPPFDDWPTLSAEAFHGLAGEIVRRLEPHTECDSAALLLTFLACFGVSVGRKPYYLVEGSHVHANEFVAVVGNSSKARKGTSWGRILNVFDETNSLAPRLSGLSSGEGLIHAVRDDEVIEVDGVFKPKAGVEDKRRIVYEAELARTLKVMKRDTNTLSAILRDAWDTGSLSVLTKGNPLTATDAHIGIVAHITTDELKKTLDDADVFNGFSNRFLWVIVRRSKLLPDGGGQVHLDDLRSRLQSAVEVASKIGFMERSEDCGRLWRSVYAELVAEKSGLYDAATSRAEAHVLRLSMIFALLDGHANISTSHLKAALAVWRYCDESARRIFSDGESGDKHERKIVQIVTATPGVMRSEIARSLPHSIKGAELDGMLRRLVARGSIVCVPVYEDRQAERYYAGTGIGIREQATPATVAGNREQGIGSTATATTPNPYSLIPTTATLAEAVEAIPPIPYSLTPTTKAATLAELFDFRNVNEADFVRKADGTIGLSIEASLPIEAAIAENQAVLRQLVPALADDSFVSAIKAADEPLTPAKEPTWEEFFADWKTW